jgi:RTX calcium-binding nonapeptide repeat (4 copies)
MAGGDDTVQSGPPDDQIDGGAGNDSIDAGDGDDLMVNGAGADLMNGGAGSDGVDFGGAGLAVRDAVPQPRQAGVGVNVTLDDQPNDGEPGEGDNAVQVENVFGTEFDDSLTGNAAANVLRGGPGADALTGLAGNDELFGDTGDDVINPGASPDGSRDFVFCGKGFDVALSEPLDAVDPSCERHGVRIVGESANVKRKGKVKVLVACPLDARDPCGGTLTLFTNEKPLSKSGSFELAAGATDNAKVKLTRKGRKALTKADGKLLVTARAETVETGGVAVSEAQVLLTGKAKKKK